MWLSYVIVASTSSLYRQWDSTYPYPGSEAGWLSSSSLAVDLRVESRSLAMNESKRI